MNKYIFSNYIIGDFFEKYYNLKDTKSLDHHYDLKFLYLNEYIIPMFLIFILFY